MKPYVSPKVVNYFTDTPSIVPLAAVAASVTAAEVGVGLAAGVAMGMMGGRRDIYKGPNKGLMPIDIISPTEV
jgi:hypothetical protein